MELRRLVLGKKALYKSTRDDLIAIDAAVDKAVYIVNGGIKTIILPNYCDDITRIAIHILKFKAKKFDYKSQEHRILNYLNTEFTTIDKAELIDGILYLTVGDGEKLNIAIEDTYNTEKMLELASHILQRITKREFSAEELEQFKKSVYRVTRYTDDGVPYSLIND